MLHVLLAGCLCLAAAAQQVDDDWIDPFDMLNYDASTKSMRKPGESGHYPNVRTSRREHSQEDSSQAELTTCNGQVTALLREIEQQKRKIMLASQQPTCYPVFKRFFSRLLKEIQRAGLPPDSADVLYDAKIRLSRQAMTEIQTLLEGDDRCRTGALDHAISQILVDLRPHDHEMWRWRFEDTFGVELDTLLKVALFVLVIMGITCTQLWSTVSWFLQFRRLFIVSFLVSIVWNWFYLYKIAFAEHQTNIVKMDSFNDKCTGVKKIDWSDGLKEWFRSTWTLQDDPCKRYYEVLMVNPILLVPPTKAISVTITTFITEPLKHLGQGISEFLRALLKDLPVTLQIPVLLTIVLAVVVCMYGSVQAAFQYGITAPLRRRRRDPPPPELEEPQPHFEMIEGHDRLAGGDAPQHIPRLRGSDATLQRNQFRQRRPHRAREEPATVVVETLRTINSSHSEDEPDAKRREGSPEAEQIEHNSSDPESDPRARSEPQNQQEPQEEQTGASAKTVDTHSKAKTDAHPRKAKPSTNDSSQSEIQPLKDENDTEPRSQPNAKQPSPPRDGAQNLVTSAEDVTSCISVTHVETVGIPVQETSPTTLI